MRRKIGFFLIVIMFLIVSGDWAILQAELTDPATDELPPSILPVLVLL